MPLLVKVPVTVSCLESASVSVPEVIFRVVAVRLSPKVAPAFVPVLFTLSVPSTLVVPGVVWSNLSVPKEPVPRIVRVDVADPLIALVLFIEI